MLRLLRFEVVEPIRIRRVCPRRLQYCRRAATVRYDFDLRSLRHHVRGLAASRAPHDVLFPWRG